MSIIHKLIEPGAEGYLPFMLARDREFRRLREEKRRKKRDSLTQSGAVVYMVDEEKSTSVNKTIVYEFGDVTAELRMVGNQSFIRLERGGGGASTAWVAYSCEPNLRISSANRVGKTNGPDGTKRPEPPPYPDSPPAPDEPVFDTTRFRLPGGKPHPSFLDQLPASPSIQKNNYEEHASALQKSYDEIQTRLRKLIEGNPWFTQRSSPENPVAKWDDQKNQLVVDYSLWDGVSRRALIEMSEPVYFNGELVLPSFPYINLVYSYDPANDYFYQFFEWLMTDYFAYAQAFRAWLQSGEALLQQYRQTLIQWNETVLKPWEALNLPSQVCPPYFTDLLPKQRSGRAAQIIALNNEMDKGIKSVSMFGPALRPNYVPMEEPQDPFTNGVGGQWIGPGVPDSITGITGPARYDSTTQSREDIIAASPLDSCDATAPAVRFVNYYIGNSDVVGINTQQAYGYRLNGRISRKEPEVPQSVTSNFMSGYDDWIESARKEGQGTVSFDLLYGPSVGEVYIAMFEFYAYDAYTEQWQWIPTPSLLEYDWQPINQCYLTCVSYPDHDREAIYKNRPLHGTSTAMRSRRFIKHTRSANGEWSDAITIQAPVITLDVTGQNYFFPSMFVAVRGVQTWMLPKDPYPTTAVDAKFMAKQSISAPFTGGYADTMTWLHAQCLSRFNIPFN